MPVAAVRCRLKTAITGSMPRSTKYGVRRVDTRFRLDRYAKRNGNFVLVSAWFRQP